MAIGVQLRDEHGRPIEVLAVDQFALENALPVFDNEAYPYLRLIDPYGDTTFGRYQMAAVLPELERRLAEVPSKELEQVIGLAQTCAANPHTYLVFVGD